VTSNNNNNNNNTPILQQCGFVDEDICLYYDIRCNFAEFVYMMNCPNVVRYGNTECE